VLVAARKKKRLSQAEVAQRAGVSQPTVSDWDNDRALPRVPSVAARIYGVALKWLVA
jgi:transcriptional regulator with XRE-family HTH domain